MEWKKSCTFHKILCFKHFVTKCVRYLITSSFACIQLTYTNKKNYVEHKKKRSQYMYAFWFEIVRTFTLWIIYIFFLLTFCGSLGSLKWFWNVYFFSSFYFSTAIFMIFVEYTVKVIDFLVLNITPEMRNKKNYFKNLIWSEQIQWIWSSHMRNFFDFNCNCRNHNSHIPNSR